MGAVPILIVAILTLPIPTYRVRVNDRVRNMDKLHLWLRRTQTVMLFPQLCCKHSVR